MSLAVSVVIVSARPIRLAFALDSLAEQTLDPSRFEVIVVRDPGVPHDETTTPEGLDVRFLDGVERSNIAALRNLGWRAAGAPLVAFTDDDCRPDPRWLETALDAAGPDRVVQGRTVPDPDERHLLHGLAKSQEITGPSSWHQTCNIVYPREMLETLGGFDERFAQLGEDADLGLRAIAAGARMVYADGCLVYHAVNARTASQALRQARSRNTIPLLIRRHPEQRDVLYGRIFWTRAHAFVLLGLLGTLLARRRPAALLAWAPYLAENLSPEALRGPRRTVRSLASVLARAGVDSVEVAATARAAVANRTLVL
jgi:GT2 family glycosyltransferase